MASLVTILGNKGTIFRGSPWKIAVPLTVTVDGTAYDYTATGSLQLQYRTKTSTAAATRWNSGDGAARFETGTSYNYFLVPDDDAMLGSAGDGNVHYVIELDYIDTNTDEHPVGIGGTLTVSDRESGAPA